ncbi:ribosome-associated translation inhibitor RaiA [Candidatus Saccharibacteria bacterium]|nr:ribosome-associated translation inhibitor RaiA [Candidatus Saccharibacteria bacterium]
MIEQITVTGINYDVSETTEKYIQRRIGKIDKFIPRHARKSATAKVTVREVNKSHGNKYEVEVTINLPHKNLNAKDESGNVLAAIDILEAKLAIQAKKYKVDQLPHIGKRGLWARLKRTTKND